MAAANKHKVLSPSNLNIIGLSEDITPDTAADYLATYDASAGQNKKVLLDNLGLGGGNAFTIMQPDSGTAPTASSGSDTLTFTSSDSSISIVGDSGTDTLTLNVDVNALTAEATVDGATDYLMMYDASATALRKVLISNLPSGGGSGDVTGPSSSIDNTIVRFDGVTGKIIQAYTGSSSDIPVISDAGHASFPRGAGLQNEGIGLSHSIAASVGNQTALGYYARVTAAGGTAIGANSLAQASGTAIGSSASANSASGSTAIGSGAAANSGRDTAIGFASVTSGSDSTAIGYIASAGINSICIGSNSLGTGDSTVVIGKSASSTTVNSAVSIGASSSAGALGTSIGSSSTTGTTSVSIGNSSSAAGINSTAVGASAKAIANHSIAIGYGADCNSYNSVVIGRNIADAHEQFVIGSIHLPITKTIIGNGTSRNGNAIDVEYSATAPITGTDLSGGDITLLGTGRTGAGLGGSVKIKTVVAGTTGTTQSIVGQDMFEANSAGEIILNAEDTETADASLWANSLSMYLDETNDNLIVKTKYADGTTIPSVILPLTGQTLREVESISGAATLDNTSDIVLCDATSAAFTITLPAASTSINYRYTIKKTDSSANVVTVDGNASETIDGATTNALSTQYDSIEIHCDGSNWHII